MKGKDFVKNVMVKVALKLIPVELVKEKEW